MKPRPGAIPTPPDCHFRPQALSPLSSVLFLPPNKRALALDLRRRFLVPTRRRCHSPRGLPVVLPLQKRRRRYPVPPVIPPFPSFCSLSLPALFTMPQILSHGESQADFATFVITHFPFRPLPPFLFFFHLMCCCFLEVLYIYFFLLFLASFS